MLYRLKYGKDRSTVDAIADTVADFLRGWNIAADALVPVPPSNIGRSVQPVIEVARAVCKRTGIPLCQECVKKVRSTGQLKDVFEFEKRAAALAGAFAVDPGLTQGKRLLLFDDLYRSGATVDQIARTLTAEGHAGAVFVLALTRTRSNV